MKFNKRIIIDLLVLVIPLIVVFFLTPVLPEKVPIQWTFSGSKFVASRLLIRIMHFFGNNTFCIIPTH